MHFGDKLFLEDLCIHVCVMICEVCGALSCHVGTLEEEGGCGSSSSGTFEAEALSSGSYHAHLSSLSQRSHPHTPAPPTSELHVYIYLVF